MILILGKLYTNAQLIKHQKLMIAKLEKRHHRILKRIQSAEAKIEETLGVQLRNVSDELSSYCRGLDHLRLSKEGARRLKK